jgi:hypothetical protein
MAPRRKTSRSDVKSTDLCRILPLGWANHAAGKQETAEEYLRKAVELGPNSIDAHFALGLALKPRTAAEAVILPKGDRADRSGELEDHARSEMVRRLAIGHINQIERGLEPRGGSLAKKEFTHRND